MDSILFQGNLVDSTRILYTPSSFAKSNLLHLQEIGELQAKKPHESRRNNLASFLFFVVESGSGRLEYNNKTFSLQAGDCVFIDCKNNYSHSTSENLWSLQWVHFYGPNMNAIYEKYVERGGLPVFHPAKVDTYCELLSSIQETADSASYVKDMEICAQLTSLLTTLMEDSWRPDTTSSKITKKQNLQSIKEYLEVHYQETISLDQLADEFYINKFYLTRVFKEQYGTTINNYLLQIRITHAKQLLRFTDLPIEKIGHECGLSTVNYFTRMFKKVEGITPGKYKQQW